MITAEAIRSGISGSIQHLCGSTTGARSAQQSAPAIPCTLYWPTRESRAVNYE